jgi:hypothetical protein
MARMTEAKTATEVLREGILMTGSIDGEVEKIGINTAK